MIIPNIWENKKCSKPPTSKFYLYLWTGYQHLPNNSPKFRPKCPWSIWDMDLHWIPADSPPLWWRHRAQALDPECPEVRPEKNPQDFTWFYCVLWWYLFIYIYAEYDGVINQLQPPHITGWCYINTAADATNPTNALGCSSATFSYRGTVTNTAEEPSQSAQNCGNKSSAWSHPKAKLCCCGTPPLGSVSAKFSHVLVGGLNPAEKY